MKKIFEQLKINPKNENLYITAFSHSSYVNEHRDKCPKRKEHPKYEYDSEKLERLWNEGKSVKEIADELGISRATVDGYVNTHRDKCQKKKEIYIKHQYCYL